MHDDTYDDGSLALDWEFDSFICHTQSYVLLRREHVATTPAQANAYNHLTEQEAVEQNNLAISIAMRMLALCCPRALPNATRQNVKDLIVRYEAWCESHPELSLVDDDDEDDDADDDDDDDSDKDDQADTAESAAGEKAETDSVKILAQKAALEQLADKLTSAVDTSVAEALSSIAEKKPTPSVGDDSEKSVQGGVVEVMKAILDYEATTSLSDAFGVMLAFVRAAEAELPHGLQPAQRRNSPGSNKYKYQTSLQYL